MASCCFSSLTGRCLSACPRAHLGPKVLYESHLHLHCQGGQGRAELSCPEELWGIQDAAPLIFSRDFGKHLSCLSQLKESVAAMLRRMTVRGG